MGALVAMPRLCKIKLTMPTSWHLRKFPIKDMKLNANVLLIGGRGSGKTSLLGDMFYHHRHDFDIGVTMSGSVDSVTGDTQYDYFPPPLVYDHWDEAAAQSMWDLFARYIRHYNEGRRRKYNIYLVSDDLSNDHGAMKSKLVSKIDRNGRHRNIFNVRTLHYATDVKPSTRENVDYVFVFGTDSPTSIKLLREYFFGCVPAHLWPELCRSVLVDHQCLVVDRTKQTRGMEKVFWYKADSDLPRFQVGDPLFWKLAELTHIDPWRKSDEEEKRHRRMLMADRHAAVNIVVDKPEREDRERSSTATRRH